MRTGTLIAVLSLVAATAGVAYAGGSTYSGAIEGGSGADGSISFRAALKDGVAKRISGLSWTDVLASCAQGQTTFDGAFGKAMPVRRKTASFHGTINDAAGGEIYVRGGFRKKNQKRATGVFKVRHWTIDSAHTDCAVGTAVWSAH